MNCKWCIKEQWYLNSSYGTEIFLMLLKKATKLRQESQRTNRVASPSTCGMLV